MATFTERQALRQRMEEIKQERRDLNSEYTKIFDRLRELDESDGKDVDVDSVVGSLSEAITVLKDLVPNIPAETLVRQVANIVNNNEIHIEQPMVQVEPVAPQHVIRNQQMRDGQRLMGSTAKQIRTSVVLPVVQEVLSENGGPMKAKDIKEEIEIRLSYSYSSTAFNSVLQKALELIPSVEKVSHGYYQIKQ